MRDSRSLPQTRTVMSVRRSESFSPTMQWLTLASCLLATIWPIPYVPAAALLWVLMLPMTAPRLRLRPLLVVSFCLLLTLCSNVVVGTLNGSPQRDLVKLAVGLCIMLLTVLTVTDLLSRSPRAQWGLIIGPLGLSLTLAAALFWEPAPGYDIWKYGLAWPTTLGVVGFGDYFLARGAKRSGVALFLGIAGVLFVTSFRSMGGIVLAALLVSLSRSSSVQAEHQTTSAGAPHSRPHRKGIYTLGGLAAAIAIASYGMGNGLFGTVLQAKWQEQGGTPWAALMNGRPELKFSLNVLKTNLVAGYGAGNPLPAAAVENGRLGLSNLSLGDQLNLLERIAFVQVNVHSFLLDMWLQGSVVAVAGPLCAVVIAIAVFLGGRARPTPLVAFSSLIILWDFLFSPMTFFSPVLWGIVLAVLVAELGRRRLRD